MIALSHRIHSNPEIGFEELHSSSWVAEILSDGGFDVKRGICDLPTAFAAHRGTGPLRVILCAEYDALPEIGHSCGHNIIAAIAAGAGLALAECVDELGITLTVLGTPAEEVGNGGGKILLLDRGAFAGAHMALMAHPAPYDSVRGLYLAAATYKIEYGGRAAHASASPQLGINAADALTVAQCAIGLLRQHIDSLDRIHGIVLHGGDAPNVIPAYTSAKYILRSRSIQGLKKLATRVHACFKAGAMATGCKLRITGGDKPYAEMHQDEQLVALYKRNAELLGRRFDEKPGEFEPIGASTDMGNVSYEIPSIHPYIGISSFPAVNHQPEFAAHCVSANADKAIHDGALAIAWTIVDTAQDDCLRNYFLGIPARRNHLSPSATIHQ